MADNKTATLTRSGTSVDITLTRNIKHNFEKQLRVLGQPSRNVDPFTILTDLNRVLEVIQVIGVLLDEESSPALTKFNNLRSILRRPGSHTLKWGAGTPPEFSRTGVPMKCEIRQVPGKTLDSGSPQSFYASGGNARTDTFEVTLLFAIGTYR